MSNGYMQWETLSVYPPKASNKQVTTHLHGLHVEPSQRTTNEEARNAQEDERIADEEAERWKVQATNMEYSMNAMQSAMEIMKGR